MSLWVKTNRFVKTIFPNYIWDIPNEERKIFLTFDDGPIPEITPWILDCLKEKNVKACFFCVADNVRKHPDIWVLSFRFFYGLRTVMPVAIGLSGYPPLRYLVLNGIGAIVWAVALGYAAFYFGAALETMLGDIKRYELWILAALVLIGAGLWLRRWLKGNKSVD